MSFIKKSAALAPVLLLTLHLYAQKTTATSKTPDPFSAIDKKALELPATKAATTTEIANYINSGFTTDSEKARAIFIWTASNIEYDIDNMFAINFYEKPEERITKSLSTRKGICANYAAIFNDLARKCGLQSYIISGYTKQRGFADYIPHAWCASMINGKWYLFDPTWGSGYVANGKFIKRINNDYYKVPPSVFISDHMPFDPMWEFLEYPVSNQRFYEGKVAKDKTAPYFSFTDSIATYEKLGEIEQSVSAARRIEANGVKNALIYDRLEHLRRSIAIYKEQQEVNSHNEKVERYNNALKDYNKGIEHINRFIQYRNNQFKPMKPDIEIQAMFDSGYVKITDAQNALRQIDHPKEQLGELVTQFSKEINNILAQVDEQKEWLKKYFSKNKLGRSSMFTKFTWMGIPLN